MIVTEPTMPDRLNTLNNPFCEKCGKDIDTNSNWGLVKIASIVCVLNVQDNG